MIPQAHQTKNSTVIVIIICGYSLFFFVIIFSIFFLFCRNVAVFYDKQNCLLFFCLNVETFSQLKIINKKYNKSDCKMAKHH